jgi:paraquat-inducible protein A
MFATLPIACHACDTLRREASFAPGGTARCSRCGTVLYRNTSDGLDRTP